MKKNLLFVILLTVSLTSLTQATVRYVKWNATGTHTGLSWTNAYTSLQLALTAAVSGDQIWVAKGTYKPTSGTDRTISFIMKSGVAIYGGFIGSETILTNRDWTANVTYLSGDLLGNDGANFSNNTDNSYHVIANNNNGLSSTAILDGFTIKGGNANGSVNEQYGGGMFNYSSSPSLANCTFYSNYASYYGGGMHNQSSNPTLVNCTFSSNKSAIYGGGMKNESSNPVLTNCIFSTNSALTNGGGIDNNLSSPILTNCTFSANSASTNGGGMINYVGSNAIITNCIVWGNTGGGTQGIYNASSNPTVTYSNVQGASVYSGTGNILSDPKFVDATIGDLRLVGTSPCVNIGKNSANATSTDIRGEARIQNTTIDMGAYEWTYGVDPANRYVTQNGAGSKNGSSWANAYDKTQLQTAINEIGVTEVWVAAGTYYPTTQVGGTGTRYATYQMKNGVTIYGGFAGTETSVSQRINFGEGGVNETILSGDIGTVGTKTDNCYHLFYHPEGFGLTSTAVLDGFTISGGYGVASSGHQMRGGAMYNYIGGSPTIRQCVFKDNASCLGGAVYNYGLDTDPTFENCIFKNNNAYYSSSETGWGGAIYNSTKANVTIINCLIVNNTAEVTGGGIYNYSSSGSYASNANITNTTIANNTAVNGVEYAC